MTRTASISLETKTGVSKTFFVVAGSDIMSIKANQLRDMARQIADQTRARFDHNAPRSAFMPRVRVR